MRLIPAPEGAGFCRSFYIKGSVFTNDEELRRFYSVEDLQEAVSISTGITKGFFFEGLTDETSIRKSMDWLHLLRHVASRHDLPDGTIRKAEEAIPWILAYHASLQRKGVSMPIDGSAPVSFTAPYHPLPVESSLPDIGNELMLWYCRLVERSACYFRDLTADGAEDKDNPLHEEWAGYLRLLIELERMKSKWIGLHAVMQAPLRQIDYSDCMIYRGDDPAGAFRYPYVLEQIADHEYLSVVRKVAETFSTCRSLWHPYKDVAISIGIGL